MTLKETTASVRTQKGESEEFKIDMGVSEDDRNAIVYIFYKK